MAAKKKKTVLSTVVTIIIIGGIIWMKYTETHSAKQREGSVRDESIVISEPTGKDLKSGSALTSILSPVSLSSSRFEILERCTLIDHRRNDGDSFLANTPEGKEEIRLYYVDAPESAARTYGPGENNYKRIAQQGASMGGLNQKQTTEIGVQAKLFAKKLLKGKKFRIATTREKVYRSSRIHAFVVVQWQGQPRYLHELIVAHGLGRIHTKPMTLPDNTSVTRQKKRLRQLETYAKKKNYGAWGIH